MVREIEMTGRTVEEAVNLACESPVSYTHLDVYKRQIQITCDEDKVD